MEDPSRAAIQHVYDRIAGHFASTRTRPWPEVIDFVESVGSVARALDLGCGNGRHVPALANAGGEVVAVDLSRSLLEIARASQPHLVVSWIQADVLGLPIVSDSVDVALYIATIHHLPSREQRIASLDELSRVLRPGGVGLISAWSVSHEKFDATAAHDRVIPWTLPTGETIDRFYHLYDLEEFSADLRRSALAVERGFESAGNCYAIVRVEPT